MYNVKDSGAEKHYFRKRAVRITAMVIALILSALFSVAFAVDFNTETALFENGSIIAGVAYYGSLALTLLLVVLVFVLVPKEKADESVFPQENEYPYYFTVESGFVRAFRIALAVLVAVQGVVRAVCDGIVGKGYLTVILTLVLSFSLALYFVPEITEKIVDLNGRLHLVFGILGMLWLLINTFITYFNREFPIASEYMVLSEVGYILALLALTYEIRYRLDNTCIRARLATSCVAFTFGTGFGVGRIIMLLAKGQVSYTDTALAVTMLALSLYFGVRVVFYSED